MTLDYGSTGLDVAPVRALLKALATERVPLTLAALHRAMLSLAQFHGWPGFQAAREISRRCHTFAPPLDAQGNPTAPVCRSTACLLLLVSSSPDLLCACAMLPLHRSNPTPRHTTFCWPLLPCTM
jgi:hypothetical protein